MGLEVGKSMLPGGGREGWSLRFRDLLAALNEAQQRDLKVWNLMAAPELTE
jgi:hypothetical protein